MTSGDATGTNGADPAADRRAFWICMAGALLFIAAINTVNALSWLSEDPHAALARVIVTEASSGLTAIALLWIPWLTLKRLPLDRPPLWRTLGLHLAALLVFSALHVAAFSLLRLVVLGALGIDYEVGPWLNRFVYELRKDALYYAMVMVTFWLVRDRILRRAAPAAAAAEPATFDIRDGARLVRAELADILAVSSAGNYAEFHLADGRRPLMRASLASLEARLGAQGFVRTHRSWLVNAARVTELTPEGSGDYAVTVGGVVAPLSRRFPQALARLRGG
ncbi:MAG: LytTR family DNA-binding domain-containing protein [Caulobacter sp.]|nr:LytTR family DNA-binding domain-containing protein [Caulobacter sp.]